MPSCPFTCGRVAANKRFLRFRSGQILRCGSGWKGEGGAADPELTSEFDQISLFIEDCPDITRCIDAWIPSNGAVLAPISLVSPVQAVGSLDAQVAGGLGRPVCPN
jgi:hypothetical protein